MRTLLVIFLLLASKGTTQAHPHAFIDTKLEIIFNEKGEITALKQEWLFDEIYSADVLNRGSAAIPALADKMLNSLKEWDYFNFLSQNQTKQKFIFPTEKESRMEGKKLYLGFTLPLGTPLSVQKAIFAIFDPTYYVAIMPQENNAISLKNAPSGCFFKLISPNPSAEMAESAKALDKNQKGSSDWGFYFAEKVEIECSLKK